MQKRSKGVLLSYLHTIVNMLCGLILSAFLLRVLGNTEYGIYQTIASFANYLVLLEFGMGTVMVRNVSVCRGLNEDKRIIEKNISTIWTVTVFLTVVILLVSIVFYSLIPMIYAKTMESEQITYARQIFAFITGYLIVSFLSQTLNGTILAFENYTFTSVQNIARTTVRFVLLILMLMAFPYAILIAVVDLLLNLCCFSASYVYCRKKLQLTFRLRDCEWKIVKSAIPLAVAVFLQSIVNQANNSVDKFLIGMMLSPESVAIYSVPLYIYSIFSALTTIPISMYAPSVVKKVSQGCHGSKLVSELSGSCRLTALIGGLVLFGFTAVGRQFIDLVYGTQYLEGWLIAIVLMVPMYLNMTNGVLVNVLDALNKRMLRSVVLLITTILNIVLSVFWLKRWGMVGATVATAVCTTIGQVLIMNLIYSKVLGIPVLKLFQKAFRGILLPQLIGCAVAFYMGNWISHKLLSFGICGIIFVTISVGGYVLFGLTDDEKKAVKQIMHRGKAS